MFGENGLDMRAVNLKTEVNDYYEKREERAKEIKGIFEELERKLKICNKFEDESSDPQEKMYYLLKQYFLIDYALKAYGIRLGENLYGKCD